MPMLEANGLTFHYAEQGEGFPVLMGHSLLLDGDMFAPQVGALSEKYRCISIDFRGHGRSAAVSEPFTLEDYRDDVFAVADALGIERFHWVGLSQGGMTGMRMALHRPERIAGLVLLDTSADVEEPQKLQQFRMFADQMRKAPLAEPMAKMALAMTFFTQDFLAENPGIESAYAQKLMGNDGESIYHATMAVIERESILDELASIKLPTLIMVGERDTATTPEKSRQIHERIADSGLKTIPGAAHISTLENPDFVNEQLLTFFAGWEA